jgi:hypothetical protein
VEVRHLEFDGVAAVYFETLLRLRRGPARAIEPDVPGVPAVDLASEARPAVAARPTTMKLQKLLNAEAPASPRAGERPTPVRDHAPVVSMVTRQSAVTARVERPRPAPEPVSLPEPQALVSEPVAEPVAVIAPPVLVEPEVAVVAPTLPSLAVAEPEPEKITLRALPELSLEPIAPVAASAPAAETTAVADEPRVSFKDLAAALLGTETPAAVVAPEPVLVVEPQVEETIALVTEPVAVVEPEVPALTVEALIASATPAVPPAAAPAAEPAKPQMALPQEFAGLNFPNDGVLTRQWMEFLNQMSSSK